MSSDLYRKVAHCLSIKIEQVHSGQLRHYYRATCSCGWRAEGRRCNRPDARDDHKVHVAGAGSPLAR